MSGYHLYRSSSLQTFPDRYPELFLADNPLADPVYVIVQNAGLGKWLTRFLTQKQGGVMGLRILMPEQALRKFALGFPSACRLVGGDAEKLLFLDGMQLTLYKALEEIPESDQVFSPVHEYLESDRTGRLWQLASVLAPIFHHYGMNCRPLVDSWEAGHPYPGLKDMDSVKEAWQRHLWRRVFHPQAPYAHLSQVLSAVSRTSEEYDGESSRIVLFGSTFLGERGLEFFQKLAAFLDVHHFILSPCSANDQPSQPFLVNNARLSNGFNALIPILKEMQLQEYWVNTGPEESTLHRLRSSLINDEDFAGPPADDGSLSFHDTTGIRRSIEVLKDQILTALAKDDELAPTHIGILAPEIGLYAPYIAAIFPSLDKDGFPRRNHLPYNITDLPARDESPFPSALSALLDLAGSRFGRSELLRLLENPCFAPTGADPGRVEQWKMLIENLNIRWGLDEKHRRSVGAADPRTGSWEQGFQRILAGYYHDEGDNPDMLPMPNLSDTLAEDAGRLMHIVMKLAEEVRPLDKQTMSLRKWTSLWERLVAAWLLPRQEEPAWQEDENHRIRVKNALRDLNTLSDDVENLSDFTDANIPWPVFRSLFDEFRSNSAERHGRYLTQGVSCGSLKPTRAIPFRRIYVLGLDENIWPGRDALPGFDLREKIPRVIDLSRESIDRFALLEVLYSASEHLSLFYTGRDQERGEVLSPSAPVLELMGHLGEGVDKLIRRHPLVPYDPAALTGEGPLATTSTEAFALAEERRKPPAPAESLPLPLPENEEVVDWKILARFLKNPVEHFYRQRLGAGFILEGMEPEDFDLLESEPLRWWRQRDEAVREKITSLEHPEEFVQEFCRRGSLESAVCRTPLAELQSEKWKEDARALHDQLRRISREGFHSGPSFSCRFTEHVGGFPSLDTISAENPEPVVISLPVPRTAAAEEPSLRINGTVDGVRFLYDEGKPNRQIWTLVDFISRMTPSSAHSLRSWTAALVLAAALGENAPKEIRVFRLGKRDYKAKRYYFKEDQVPIGSGGEKRLISNPQKLLDRLVWAYRKGTRMVLPLYPELADELGKALKSAGTEDFEAMAVTAWNKIVTNSYSSFSSMRDCPWRQRFLTQPSLDGSHLRQILTELYIDGGIL